MMPRISDTVLPGGWQLLATSMPIFSINSRDSEERLAFFIDSRTKRSMSLYARSFSSVRARE